MTGLFIHPTAEISPEAHIGAGTRIWGNTQICEGARIGSDCIIGRNVFVDVGVVVGNRVKVQGSVSLVRGVTLEDGVFVGPHAAFTNDLVPRAINVDGSLKGRDDWTLERTLVRMGASIGCGAVILPNLTIGSFALIGAGSVVTRTVPDHALIYGNPARQHGYVCRCGRTLISITKTPECVHGICPLCRQQYALALAQ